MKTGWRREEPVGEAGVFIGPPPRGRVVGGGRCRGAFFGLRPRTICTPTRNRRLVLVQSGLGGSPSQKRPAVRWVFARVAVRTGAGLDYCTNQTRFSFSYEIILDRIRINLLDRLTYLLKCFRYNENKKEVNLNHLKHIFYCFMVAGQKLGAF
jgi:hypothetical protein